MWSGVSKSGSPALKLQISIPALRMALALESIAKVMEEGTFATLAANFMISNPLNFPELSQIINHNYHFHQNLPYFS
jgi:hypothetical protein